MDEKHFLAFCVTTSLAIIFDIVALSTTGWAVSYSPDMYQRIGIFKECSHRLIYDLEPFGYGHCQIYSSPSLGGSLAAAFLILTIFFLSAAIGTARLGHNGKGKQFIVASAVLCAVSIVFVIIGSASFAGLLYSSVPDLKKSMTGPSFPIPHMYDRGNSMTSTYVGYAYGFIGMIEFFNISSVIIAIKSLSTAAGGGPSSQS